MTLAQLLRKRAAIMAELAKLSRNGWRDALPCDYLPLERELQEVETAIVKKRK